MICLFTSSRKLFAPLLRANVNNTENRRKWIDSHFYIFMHHYFSIHSTYNLKVESYNATKNWTQAMYNLTFSLVNATVGFVNGSLVNETMCHYTHLPDYIYFKALNMCNSTEQSCKDGACMVQQGVLKFLNKSMSPMFAVVMKLKSLRTLKAEDVVEWLQPQSKPCVWLCVCKAVI